MCYKIHLKTCFGSTNVKNTVFALFFVGGWGSFEVSNFFVVSWIFLWSLQFFLDLPTKSPRNIQNSISNCQKRAKKKCQTCQTYPDVLKQMFKPAQLWTESGAIKRFSLFRNVCNAFLRFICSKTSLFWKSLTPI